MGLFSAIGGLFGGKGGIIGEIADGLLGRDDAQDANRDNMNNARQMRQTAYQDTVLDLQAAGLNPMLAYSNGPTSGAMPPMQNKGLQGAQTMQASSAASLAATQKEKTEAETSNVEAQTRLLEVQRLKTEAEIPQITTSTANIAEQTKKTTQEIYNLKQELDRIYTDTQLKYSQTMTETQRRALMEAQEQLAKIDRQLRASQINNTDAITETQKVITRLKQYEIPGAKNTADFETMLETEGGNAGTVAGKALNAAKTVREMLKGKP